MSKHRAVVGRFGFPELESTAGVALGDGLYRCVLPERGEETVELTVRDGAASTTLGGVVIGEASIPDVVLWRPAVAVQQVDQYRIPQSSRSPAVPDAG